MSSKLWIRPYPTIKINFPYGTRTVFLSLFIIISALCMRQVLNFFLLFATRRQLAYTLAGAMLMAGGVLVYLLLKERAWRRLAIIFAMMIALALFAQSIPLPEERFHLLEFFFVGYLAADDGRLSPMWRRVFWALVAALAIPALDEGFQYFIPWRVADIRDVGFGFVGAACGVLFNCLYFPKQKV